MKVVISDIFPEDQRNMLTKGIQTKLDEMWEPTSRWTKEQLEEYAEAKQALEMFLPKKE